jgi:predicted helicase
MAITLKSKLQNPCVSSHPDSFKSVFEKSTSIRTFTDNVIEESGKVHELDRNKFKGDCMELLTECLFTLAPVNSAFGLTNYKHVPLSNDYGVDGIGTNANGDICAVQVKFRADADKQISFNEVGHVFLAAVNRGVDPAKLHNIILVTNTVGVTTACKQEFGPRAIVLGAAELRREIDNNVTWWKHANELVEELIAEFRTKQRRWI